MAALALSWRTKAFTCARSPEYEETLHRIGYRHKGKSRPSQAADCYERVIPD